MRRSRAPSLVAIAVALCLLSVTPAAAENIDPVGDDSQYAWAENTGWISLSCRNTLSCATTDYGVINSGSGILSGHAWGENVGRVNFAPTTSGVTIDPATGEFSGHAWGENVGWISFNCANTASCGTVDYKVKTGWICDPPPAPPAGVPTVTLSESDGEVLLSWTTVPGATQYDIVMGDLAVLRATGGDFTLATMECLDDNRTTVKQFFEPGSEPFEGAVVMVRGTNCGGNGSYDSGAISQVGLRDVEIAGSGSDCQ